MLHTPASFVFRELRCGPSSFSNSQRNPPTAHGHPLTSHTKKCHVHCAVRHYPSWQPLLHHNKVAFQILPLALPKPANDTVAALYPPPTAAMYCMSNLWTKVSRSLFDAFLR